MRPTSPEILRELGEAAAKRYLDLGTLLNQAVVSVIQGRQLSAEQIKRVCEFANTTAFMALFNKSGERKNVVFEGGPADPDLVVKRLQETAGAPPVEEKAMKKVSHTKSEISLPNILELQSQLQKTASYMHNKKREFDFEYAAVCDKLTYEVKTAMASGLDPDSIASCIKKASTSDYFYNLALQEIRSRVPQFKADGHRKLASFMLVNPSHPIMTYSAAFSKVAKALMTYTEAAKISTDNFNSLFDGVRKWR